MRRVRGEHGGILIGWIVKLLVSLALVGLALFETGAVIVSKVVVDRISIDAAQEAALEYGNHGSREKARDVAEAFAVRNGAEVVGFKVLDGGKRIEVTLRKVASTLLVQRIGPLEKFATAEATNTAPVR